MGTNLYLVRHGESRGNLTDCFLGHTDWPLTEKGEEQAKRVASYFKNIKIDAVYSSDLERAVETIRPTAEDKCLPIITDRNLREIFVGEWEGRSFTEIRTLYSDVWKVWIASKTDCQSPGGESLGCALDRVYSELCLICDRHDGQNVIVTTHGAVSRLIINRLVGRSLSELYLTGYPANAAITRCSYESGMLKLISADERTHLDGLVTTIVV